MMLINAGPRLVSNGFETFVPNQRVESLHQRLGEMTNNDLNAWSVPRPVSTFPSESWDQQLDDFSSNENFPLHTIYSGGHIQSAPNPGHRAVNYQKAPTYSAVQQYQQFKMLPQQVYHEPVPNMSCFGNESPMLGNDYSKPSHRSRNGSFEAFFNTRNGLNDFQYLPDADCKSFESTSTAPQQAAYQENISGMADYMTIHKTTPSTVYTGYSTSGSAVDPMSLVSSNVPTVQNNAVQTPWWPESSKSNKNQTQDYTAPVPYDALPRAFPQPAVQQYTQPLPNMWGAGNGSTNTWMDQRPSVSPATISPKALTLTVQPPAMSAMGSNQGSTRSLSPPESTSTSSSSSDEEYPDPDEYTRPEQLNVIVPVRRHRQLLPDSIPMSKRVTPAPPIPGERSSRRLSLRSSDAHRRDSSSIVYSHTAPTTTSSQTRRPLPTPKRIEPKPTIPSPPQTWADKPQSAATIQAMHHRDAKDDFLVRQKLAGVPYKEIRKLGKFTEAESTLRGRFRTLTKHKTARVRKPEWNDNDVRLLKKAVRKLAPGSNKVPWKQVAEYIVDNGGSYHFGNATCRKKWDELCDRH